MAVPANDQLLHPLAGAGCHGSDCVGRFGLSEIELTEHVARAVGCVDRQNEIPSDIWRFGGNVF